MSRMGPPTSFYKKPRDPLETRPQRDRLSVRAVEPEWELIGASATRAASSSTRGAELGYCQSCGQEIGDDWIFCRHCGVQIEHSPPSPVGPSSAARSDGPTAQRSEGRRPLRIGMVIGAIVVVVASGTGISILALSQRNNRAVPLAGPSTARPTDSPAASPTPSISGSFAALFADQGSGVIRVEAISCGQSDIGTGFLIRPDLVATVNHVVADPVTIALSSGNDTTTGVVIGSDPSQDLALVRADRPFSGYVFALSSLPPQVGDAVAAMGYPENLPLTFTEGTVSGLDRSITVDGGALNGLVQTDTAVNPGSSGGPLIDISGRVMGLIDAKQTHAEGIGYAIEADVAASTFSSWEQSGIPQPPASCTSPIGPPGAGDVPTTPSDPAVAAMAETLAAYHNAINAGDYLTAWEQFTPAEQQRVTVDHLASADATSFGFEVRIHQVTRLGTEEAVVYVTFTSIQAPGYGPNGETCDYWTLDYTMRLIGGRWLIDHAGPHDGSTHTPC